MMTAFVTGGAGGIGAAVCRRLAAEGQRVAVGYRTHRAEAEALAREIGGTAVFCDVSDPACAAKAVDNVLDKFCQLDNLICNAGTAWQGLLQDMDEGEYRRVMGADLDGTVYCCRAALPAMLGAKEGRIVTVSSVWGRVGASCEAVYSAAKAGVIGFTKALAKEVGPSGIRVNCVAPGVIDTPMNAHLGPEALEALAEATPLGRLGTPEEVAEAVAFFCSPRSRFITGQVLGVDGGFEI